jgi:small-conductance mechanosensitive channel
MGHIELEVKDWVLALSILAAAVISGLAIQLAVFAALKRIAKKTDSIVDDALVRRGRRPARVLVPLVAVLMALPFLAIPEELVAMVRHGVILGLIAAAAWLVISLTAVFDDVVFSKFQIDTKDNLAARQVRTKTYVLRRIIVIAITVFALSVMLMTFPTIRNVGVSLFASAGVAGLVIGMAARPMLSNVIAGIQIALTQPIRIDDVVIVEGEWGWIEEIGSTYVVVRIWDLRRMVLPLTYFMEKPFQNWTRRTADILGTVFLYTDYTIPVEEVRQELHRVLQSTKLWDGKTWGLQVTNASEHTMELRALMSAPDSGTAWDLRCYVREKLIGFLQEKYPQSLPRVRAELGGRPQAKGGGEEHDSRNGIQV